MGLVPIGQTPGVPEIPVTTGTSGTSGALVTTKIPATTNTPGNPSCSSGQTLYDGSCIDTQSNSQHCGACGNVCNTSEPCSEGKCLSWAGSWWSADMARTFELTQTGTSVSGFDSTYHHITISVQQAGIRRDLPVLGCHMVKMVLHILSPVRLIWPRMGNRSTAVCSEKIPSPIPGNRTDLLPGDLF